MLGCFSVSIRSDPYAGASSSDEFESSSESLSEPFFFFTIPANKAFTSSFLGSSFFGFSFLTGYAGWLTATGF